MLRRPCTCFQGRDQAFHGQAREPLTSTTSPGARALVPRAAACLRASWQAIDPAGRHAGLRDAPAATSCGVLAAGHQQVGPAERDDFVAQAGGENRSDSSPSSRMSPQTTIRRPGASKSRSSSSAARMAVGLAL